jgi:hypothetical protein
LSLDKDEKVIKHVPSKSSARTSIEEVSEDEQSVDLRHSRSGRKGYSPADDTLLVRAVVRMIQAYQKRDKLIELGGNDFWKNIQSNGWVPHRTWQSMRDHFSKSIMKAWAHTLRKSPPRKRQRVKHLPEEVMNREQQKVLDRHPWIKKQLNKYK